MTCYSIQTGPKIQRTDATCVRQSTRCPPTHRLALVGRTRICERSAHKKNMGLAVRQRGISVTIAGCCTEQSCRSDVASDYRTLKGIPMFSVAQKQWIANRIQEVLRKT
ncbi:hypothetical protein LCGC14_1064120, partial [marine sediment metagenome]